MGSNIFSLRTPSGKIAAKYSKPCRKISVVLAPLKLTHFSTSTGHVYFTCRILNLPPSVPSWATESKSQNLESPVKPRFDLGVRRWPSIPGTRPGDGQTVLSLGIVHPTVMFLHNTQHRTQTTRGERKKRHPRPWRSLPLAGWWGGGWLSPMENADFLFFSFLRSLERGSSILCFDFVFQKNYNLSPEALFQNQRSDLKFF